ncbi:MAG: hypothetical protein ACRDZ3_21075 [Acidimicrobiia bacterium]
MNTDGRRSVALARWWVRRYTAGLPAEVREARRAEIGSDLYEHMADAAGAGSSDLGVGAAVVGRTLRGSGDDLVWRRTERRAMAHGQKSAGVLSGFPAAWAAATQSWFAPAAVLLGLFNLLMSVSIAFNFDGENKMPGQLIGPAFMVAVTVCLFRALQLRWRSRQAWSHAAAPAAPDAPAAAGRPPLPLAVRLLVLVPIAVLGVAAIVGLGGPGPVFLIALLAVGAVAFVALRRRGPAGVRSAEPSPMLADALIILGTLPALGLFWMVIPPILALLVIGGVIGTNPGGRRPAPAQV